MNIILIIILILILILLIILNNGLKITTNYKIKENTFKINLKITILNIKILEKTIPKTKEKETKEEKKETPTKEILKTLKENKKTIKKLLIIFKDSTKIEELKNHINLGLSDYVQTVELIGLLYIINTILNLKDNITLTTEANFEEKIKIKGILKFKINLLKFLLKILKDKQILKFIKKIIGVLK